jgi:hypothetical protein
MMPIFFTLIKSKQRKLIISSLSDAAFKKISVLDSLGNFRTGISDSHDIGPWLDENDNHNFFGRSLAFSFEDQPVIGPCYDLLLD